MVRDLWTQDARHLLQPPIEIKDAAPAIGMIPVLGIRGHEALERRISKAYERFVAPGIFVFRRRASPERIRDLVKLNWEMIRRDNDEVKAVGLELLFLDDRDRILTDYQFIE
jgi:hypothetical protein